MQSDEHTVKQNYQSDASSSGYESADEDIELSETAAARPPPLRTSSRQKLLGLDPRVSFREEDASGCDRDIAAASSASDGQKAEDQFRIRDLDTGAAYEVDGRFAIKNIDSGQVFLVDGSNSVSAEESRKVTDLESGRSFTLGELQHVLGVAQPTPPELEQMAPQGPTLPSDKWTSKLWKSLSHYKHPNQPKTAAPPSPSTGSEADSGVLRKDAPSFPKLDAAKPAAAPSTSSEPQEVASPGQAASVKVVVHRKQYKELTGLQQVQELPGHEGVVWVMKFSPNGKYLASAGQDAAIKLWEVASTSSKGIGTTTLTADGSPARPAAPSQDSSNQGIFLAEPYRVYEGHHSDVLDLSWSKSQFLLSASMDKTVRLWHISMGACLRTFRHPDFVTTVDFHPADDKYFISGCIDGKLRLWNIPEQKVIDWADVREMVTATAFSDDGKTAVVGTMKGKCWFYRCEPKNDVSGRIGFKLEYETQVDVKNKRGKQAKGKKVTGIHFLPGDERKLLITSNDSRIRLYDGYSLRCKYKGYHNRSTQIHATFCPDGEFLVCGSDDGCVYVWPTFNTFVPSVNPAYTGYRRDKNSSYEYFQAHQDIVTVAVFAPESAQRLKIQREVIAPTKAAAALLQRNPAGALQSRSSEDTTASGNSSASPAAQAVAAAKAYGQVIVTAGYSGQVRVFENTGMPQWL